MPRLRGYVETTIPSCYYETRTEPVLVARRDWTRAWWADATQQYELVTSVTVLRELAAGTSDQVHRRMDLVRRLPFLYPAPAISTIASVYILNKLMPAKPTSADAMHLALASYYECDFIVTWNCKHLANPNKATHIQRINAALGLRVPELVTPRDLAGRRG